MHVDIHFSVIILWALVWTLMQLPAAGWKQVVLIVFLILLILALIGPVVYVSANVR
jgi:hypothetical protein